MLLKSLQVYFTLLPAWFPYHSNYNRNISLFLELPSPGILSQQHKKSRMQYIRFLLTSSDVDHQASPLPPPLFRHVKDSQPHSRSPQGHLEIGCTLNFTNAYECLGSLGSFYCLSSIPDITFIITKTTLSAIFLSNFWIAIQHGNYFVKCINVLKRILSEWSLVGK